VIDNNTSNVFAAFEILIDAIEAEIDLIDNVVTSAMKKRDHDGAHEAIVRATQITAYRDKIVSLRKDWQTFEGRRESETVEEVIPLKERNYEPELVTGTKPTTVSIFGQSLVVNSWSDVFVQTMNTIVDLRPEKFGQIMQRLPRIVGLDGKKFKRAKKLKNGIFIEVNLSALYTVRYCSQVLKMVELSAKDSVVVTAQRKNDGKTLRIALLPSSLKIQS
jgi:hypothetical protein